MSKVWDTAPSTPLDQPYHPCLTFKIVTRLELTPLCLDFLKGHSAKPSLPRYTTICDVGIVLQYLKTLHPITDLALKDLTKKITMLFCLLKEQRCRNLTKLDISLMQELPDKYVLQSVRT